MRRVLLQYSNRGILGGYDKSIRETRMTYSKYSYYGFVFSDHRRHHIVVVLLSWTLCSFVLKVLQWICQVLWELRLMLDLMSWKWIFSGIVSCVFISYYAHMEWNPKDGNCSSFLRELMTRVLNFLDYRILWINVLNGWKRIDANRWTFGGLYFQCFQNAM